MTLDPYRLSLSVTHANGGVTRWGGDELNSEDVPTGLTFSTSIPGGFKDLRCSLMRHIDRDYADEALFDDVRLYGPGNETAFEGRMVQFPRQHAEEFSVTPGAVGWAAHLRDDPSFREIYVDRDLTKWTGSSLQRKLNLIAASFGPTDPSVVPDLTTGQPALSTSPNGSWAVSSRPIVEGIYDSGGIDLKTLNFAWKIAPTVNPAVTDWTWTGHLMSTDTFTSEAVTSELRAAGPGTGSLDAGATGRKFAAVQMAFTGGAGGADNTEFGLYWTVLAVYGNHGVSPTGSALTATSSPGYFASDVIANIVARAAPLLKYTTGTSGSIATTSFEIPHLSFTDPVTAEDAISLVNGYHLYEWGVYDNREFFWRPPDPDRVTWEARQSKGAQRGLEGDDANNIFNGVFVTYTDPAGQKKTVGPPGSVANATDTSLVDTSTDNPVNAHGIPRRWGRLDVTNTTTSAGAIQLGAVWLAEHNLPSRRGQLTLTGLVHHPTQGDRPVWAVRAGDYIRVSDRPNDPVRRIIETTYDHDSRKLTASLDQTVFKIEALMERMGVNLIGVI